MSLGGAEDDHCGAITPELVGSCMAASPVSALRDQIAAGTVVTVIGTGVSVAASGHAPTASWSGLLRAGVDRATNFNRGLPPGWKEHVLKDLEYAQENDYLPDILSVADKVTIALGGKSGGEFRSWLRDDIGKLELSDTARGRELIEAIGGLRSPIVTTNYDSLIESTLSRSTSTWQDPSAAQLIIQGVTNNILHLHGAWEFPNSIIFGSMSYGELLADPAAKTVEQILAGGRSLLFVGCGAGLSDPNFESLRNWMAEIFPSSEMRHYRLCLEEDLQRLAAVHKADRIMPLPYGRSYESLSSFLFDLAPPGDKAAQLTRVHGATAQQRAIEAIHARVRTETVMAEHLADVETRALSDILIPPVLLPVTQEQFAQSVGLETDVRPKRCEPRQDVREYSHILVAAGETAGLTSTLEWMVAEANCADSSLIPIIIDFRQLGTGHRPLERQIRKELRLAGINLHPGELLPRIALAIDNIMARPDKIFSRVLDELKNDVYAFVVIGCRQGSEAVILERLGKVEIKPVLRYIGRLNNRDATKMATLIEPTRADRLASKAIEIAKNEHLPRTPLTIGLLVCMLLRGETLLSTASETALLDAWINLLLGRGDPHDDARFALDSLEKENILAFLAERFVHDKTGSLSESVALACLAEYFSAVGWAEDPIEVLGNFKNRYLLVVRNGQVRFAQSSYLHLFAAKRAIESNEFRQTLYQAPLYFSPILRHYAALTRNDPDILMQVEHLLTPKEPIDTPSIGGSFSDVAGDADSISAKSIEDLMRQLSLPGGQEEEQLNELNESEEDDTSELVATWLDHVEDVDKEPFPLEDIEDAEPVVRIMAALALVSNVLRDSELVKDLKLKERVLRRTLVIWGKLVDLLDVDEGFRLFWGAVSEKFSALAGIPEEHHSKFVERFCEVAPVLVGYSGISANLSSRKLFRSLDSCFEDEDFMSNAGGAVMGALVGFDLHEPGWSRYFIEVQRRHGRVKAVRTALRYFAEMSYYNDPLDRDDADRLLDFLVHQYIQRVEHRSAADRKRHEARISQQLRKNQTLARSRGGLPGTRIAPAQIEAPIDEGRSP
jgi:hypothetical protein